MSVYGLQVEILVGNNTAAAAFQNFAVAFERGGRAIENFGEHVYPLLVPVFEDAVDAQFEARGKGPAFGAWASLSPSYEQWKAGAAPGQPLLEFSGAMRAGLTQSSSPNALRQWDNTSFSFGTVGLPYADYHQSGTGKMPARPPFDFGADFERAMQVAAARGLRNGIKAATAGALELEGVE